MTAESIPSNPEEELQPGEEVGAEEKKCGGRLTKILVGVSIGLLAGTAIAIALRPQSRREALARSLRESGEHFADLLENAAAEVRKPLERGYALAAEAASDAYDKAEEAIGKFKKDKNQLCFWK